MTLSISWRDEVDTFRTLFSEFVLENGQIGSRFESASRFPGHVHVIIIDLKIGNMFIPGMSMTQILDLPGLLGQ